MERTALHLLQCLLLAIFTVIPGPSDAQVFIPDYLERIALNDMIPGIVDQAGIMDTLDPAIGSLAHGSIFIPYNGPSVTTEFIGLRFLHAMTSLSISVYIDSSGSFSLNGLPDSLNYLWIYSFCPIDLNTLPAGMDTVWIGGLGGADHTDVQIDAMPDSLKELFASSVHHIDWQGPFHIGTFRVNQWMNDTFHLPESSIDNLFLQSGGSVSVDLSAAEIQHTSLHGSQYSQIVLPTHMSYLKIRPFDSSQPICLPALPDDLDTLILENMAPGFCLANWPSSLTNCSINDDEVGPDDVVFCSILNSSCPGIGSGMNGHVYVDQTGDGVYGTGDLPLSFIQIHTDPDSYVTGSDSAGYWFLDLQPGSYSILPSSMYPYIQSITPAQHFANLTEQGELDTLNDFAVTLEPNIQDLQARIHADPARPGFNDRLYLSCRNYGTVPMPAQLVLNYDSDQSWVGSSIPPDTHTGNTATWNLDTLGLGRTMQLTVDLFTDATVPLGTPINHQLSAFPVSSDETPSDNVVHVNDNVVGSFDPNDKLVDPPAMTPNDAQAGDNPITYTIRFQNTGTYLAERVVIVDTLPEGLQPQSIEFLSSSHTCHWYVRDGVLHFIHANINLPDSTSDEPGSHGYVQFRILPDTDLQDGAEVTNIAHIVFDFNAPIVTPPAIFRVNVAAHMDEASAPSVRIHPNPVRDRLWVLLPDMHHDMPYTVQDLSGRLVLRGRATRNDAVDVSALQPGPYMLSVIGNAGVRTSRFVKIQ